MFRRFVLPVLAVLTFASAASASTLFVNDRIFSSVRFSDHDSAGTGFRTYDDFELTASAWLESLSWDFMFVDFDNPFPDPAPASDANQWTVSFYADNAGTPGTLLANHVFLPGDLTATYLESQVWSFGITGTFNADHYKYSVALPTPLLLTANTPYWLSVLVQSNQNPPTGGWLAGGATAGGSLQQSYSAGNPGSLSSVARDRAFALEGTVVPEPTTMLLVGGPLLAGAIRRRRNQK